MTHEQILPMSCSSEFGHPSGHSLFSSAFALYFVNDLFPVKTGKGYYMALVSAIVYFVIMGISRICVGVHSMDQVMYGWALGIWMACYVERCFKEEMLEHFRYICETTKAINLKKYLLVSSLIIILCVGSCILSFVFTELYYPPPAIWYQRTLAKCGSVPVN